MKFKRIYCIGGLNGKHDSDDFVIGYKADNGAEIKTRFLMNEITGYSYNGKIYGRLVEAKAAVADDADRKDE